jgi:hypothetical protein
MEVLLGEFKTAYVQENGYGIAQVFTPVPTPEDPARLQNFYRGSNAITLEHELRASLVYRNDLGLAKLEGNAWKDAFSAYWSALGDLLHAEEFLIQNKGRDVDWVKVYQSWRKFAECIIQGFQQGTFPYWAVPLLPMTGKYLRNLALKADANIRLKEGDLNYGGLEDDVADSAEKNENVKDAARQINRMFAACINDRYIRYLHDISHRMC